MAKTIFNPLSGKYHVQGHDHDPLAHHDTKAEAKAYARQKLERIAKQIKDNRVKEHELPYWDNKK